MITKPIVFNYREHEELREAYKELLEEVQQLRRDRTNLAIRCRILEAEKIPEWKPIEENRPAIAGNYLVSFEDGFVCSASYDGDDWELWDGAGKVDAWTLLPLSYKEVNDGTVFAG